MSHVTTVLVGLALVGGAVVFQQSIDDRVKTLESKVKVLAVGLAEMQLSSPKEAVYRELGSDQQIAKYIQNENMILLKDGSGWRIDGNAAATLEKWAPGDKVSVFRFGDEQYPYSLLYKPESATPVAIPAAYGGGEKGK